MLNGGCGSKGAGFPVKIGKLIIKKIKQVDRSDGDVLSVPTGKIWTPLYYDVEVHEGESYHYSVPQIYPDHYKGGSGWFRGTAYFFPTRKDFVSYKMARREYNPLAQEFFLCLEPLSNVNASFTFYFLEE